MRALRTTNETTDELIVGRIAGLFGIRGELKCDPTRAGRIVFSPGAVLQCRRGEVSSPVRLTSVRPHGARFLLRLEGVDDTDAASAYAGAVLLAARSDVALEAGEYLDDDLVGCSVYGLDETPYGTVDRVEHYPASDMLVVGGRLVPMVSAIVKAIDVATRRIVVDPPQGLLD